MHYASATFWAHYQRLPPEIRYLADKNFALLKSDPNHPSLHLKKVGRYWSVRIGSGRRALARKVGDEFHGSWIGARDEYARRLRS